MTSYNFISQSSYVEDIDGEYEAQQENTMYKTESLVEKQQRYFKNRLSDVYEEKDVELRTKCKSEKLVPTLVLDEVEYQKASDSLWEAKRKAEDIIMIGDPSKMYAAVEAFQNMTIH